MHTIVLFFLLNTHLSVQTVHNLTIAHQESTEQD
uniref:Uncharacterized protein n=1 Tax=Anguilla anguilla TaxID=7936 RepID=A0A0E9P725_ANGAN